MKKLLYLVLGLCALFSAQARANDYGIPEGIQESNILHCFDWTFNDIKTELPNIAKAGFGAVQVSPVQGACGSNAEWFYAYLPYDYTFKANGNGSRDQLKFLCSEAAKYGIKIIVDVVCNHINGSAQHRNSWWDSNNRLRYQGGINYGDRRSIINGQLGEYGDCNTAQSDVQQRAKTFIEDLKSLGVKGIRWDAAKHIGLPSEGDNFWKTVTSVSGLWHYGEILDGPGGDKYRLLQEYTNYIGVSDTEYSKWTLNQVNSGNVPTGHGSWTPNNVNAKKVVYWAESHDDYSNDGAYGTNTSQISQDKIDRAYAIVACRNNETALYFSRPSATSRTAIKMGQKGSTHFTTKQVAEVNKFRNAMAGTADYFSQQNGAVCITRKGGGAVIVLGNGGNRQVSMPNGGNYVPAGNYKDQVGGGTFTVTSSTISGTVGSTGIAVIYNPDHEVIVNPDPEPGPGPQPSGDDMTIYYDNSSSNYSQVMVHYWGGTSESTWPGIQMTKVSGQIYSAAVPSGTAGLVFNNGQGLQTVDVTTVADKHLYKGADGSGKTQCSDQGVYNGGGNDNPISGMPSQLYILGNLEGGSWITTNGVKMVKSGNKFVAERVVLVPAEAGITDSYFTFVTTLGSDWHAVNGADRFGPSSKDAPISVGSPTSFQVFPVNVSASAANSWKTEAGTYTITADFSTMQVTLTSGEIAGIDEFEASEAETRYFDLQSREIKNPTSGLYIVVRGTNVTKEYIR